VGTGSIPDIGYCRYRPPAPYASEFDGSGQQTCYTATTNIQAPGLPPAAYPTYNQFVKWGAASVNNKLFNSTEFGQVSRDTAIGASFGAVVGAAATAAATGYALAGITAVTSAAAGTALQLAIFPSLGIPLAATTAATATTATSASSAAAAASAASGAATVGAVAFVFGVVIVAITVAVIQGITVVDAASLPDKLATLVANAPTSTPTDLQTIIADSTKAVALYALFIGATLPAPHFASCDNRFTPSSVGADGVSVYQSPCLNPTAIPARTSADPVFTIQAKGATGTSQASAISFKNAVTQTAANTRLSGNWFISDVTVPGSQAATTVQTLRLRYSDWDGNEQSVWLLGNASGGYSFLGVKATSSESESLVPATCLADGKCSYASSIKYLGTDGTFYSASLGTPTAAVTPAQPVTVTVSVTGSYVIGMPRAVFTYTTAPAGVRLSGTLSCTRVMQGGMGFNSGLLGGTYTLDARTCSGLTAPAGYTLGAYSAPPWNFVASWPLPGQVAGARIRQPSTGQIYLVDDAGTKRYLPDPTTYNNLFRDWNGIQDVSDVASIASGPNVTSGAYLAIAQETRDKVYLIDNGQKGWVTSPAVMDNFYFSYAQIRQVPQSTLDSLPTGAPLT
jgi:hypothetical protein